MTLGTRGQAPEPASSSTSLPFILNLTKIFLCGTEWRKARGQGLGTWKPAQLPGHGQILKVLPARYLTGLRESGIGPYCDSFVDYGFLH